MYAFANTPLTASFDFSTYLEDYIGTLDNLPSETTHLLAEIQSKDKQTSECAASIRQKERALFKLQKTASESSSQEDALVDAIQTLYAKERELADEKLLFVNRALELLERHIRRLDNDMGKVQGDWLEQVRLDKQRHEDAMTGLDKLDPLSPGRQQLPNNSTGNCNSALHAQRHQQNHPQHTPVPNRSSSTLSLSVSRVSSHTGLPSLAFTTSATASITAGMDDTGNVSSSGGLFTDAKGRRMLQVRHASLSTSLSTERDLLRRKKRQRVSASPLVLSDSDAGGEFNFSSMVDGESFSTTVAGSGSMTPPTRIDNHSAGSSLSLTETGFMSHDQVDEEDNLASMLELMQGGGGVVSGSGVGGDDDDDLTGGLAGEVDGDDNRPYCYCHRPSYGQMLGCDNEECRLEWFHLDCVGFTRAPLGKWYCRECITLGFKQDQ